MEFKTFMNDLSGRAILAAGGVVMLAGGIGESLAPAISAYSVIAGGAMLGMTIATLGVTRAVFVEPRWALASIIFASTAFPLFYLSELVSVTRDLPLEYLLFPAGGLSLVLAFRGKHFPTHPNATNETQIHTNLRQG